MTNTMVLKSNLVMPTIGYELDREEMTYVDGGWSIAWKKKWGFNFGGTLTINLTYSDMAWIAAAGLGVVACLSKTIAAFIAVTIPFGFLVSAGMIASTATILTVVSTLIATNDWMESNSTSIVIKI